MNQLLNDEYNYIVEDLKEYGQSRWELTKISLLDKVSRIVGMLMFGLAIILFTFAIIVGLSIALIYALSLCMPTWAAALIIVAVWILLFIIVVALRKQIFFNPVLSIVAAILFENNAKKNITTDTIAQEEEVARYKVAEQEKNLRREVTRLERRVNTMLEQIFSIGNTISRILNIFRRK